jgi:proteic killer suppression protein
VIQSFRCGDTGAYFIESLFAGFKAIERQALRKLDILHAAQDIRTISTLPGNRLERRKGQFSIRVNDQWRVCFEWRDGHAYEVEIVDYH